MPTTQSAVAALAMAALLVLAGCAGPLSDGSPTAAPGDEPAAVTPATPANADVTDGGTVEFYISDEENAIDDFEHLNVTITKVGLHRTGDAEAGNETETDAPEDDTPVNETGTPDTITATPVNDTGTPENGTDAPDGEDDAQDDEGADDDPENDGEESEEEQDQERDEDRDGEGDAAWVEYEVNRTVDLTDLKGPNATKLDVLQAPNGSYDKVFVYVDGIEATLQNGETVNVKLPSNKLHINKGFTVGEGGSVQFVFDLSVHKAGNSGKYILKPVISESGTSDDVNIEDVDEREENERGDDDARDEHEQENDDAPESNESPEADEETGELTAEFQGPVRAGDDATLKVTGADAPVANATVVVNGEQVGTTDAAGTITVAVPEDAEAVEVAVTKGDREAELERETERVGGQNRLAALV